MTIQIYKSHKFDPKTGEIEITYEPATPKQKAAEEIADAIHARIECYEGDEEMTPDEIAAVNEWLVELGRQVETFLGFKPTAYDS